jgi:serine protease Do
MGKTTSIMLAAAVMLLPQNSIDSKKVATNAEHSVVKIIFIGGSGQVNSVGTGFFVGKGDLIATASHVYLDGEKAVVDSGGGQLLVGKVLRSGGLRFLVPFQLVSTDYQHDLALLRIDPEAVKKQVPSFQITPLELEDTRAAIGDEVIFMDYFGNDDFPLLSRTVVSGFTGVGPGTASEQLVLDLPANPGQSGSPVLSLDSGKVVGVLASFVPVTLIPGAPFTHSGLSRSVEVEHLKRLVESADVR